MLRKSNEQLGSSPAIDFVNSAPSILHPAVQKKMTIIDLSDSFGSSAKHQDGSSGRSATSLINTFPWKDTVVYRLIKTVGECSPLETLDDPDPSTLPTLIMLLYEIQVDAVLLKLENYQKIKNKRDADPNRPCVIVYKLKLDAGFQKIQFEYNANSAEPKGNKVYRP